MDPCFDVNKDSADFRNGGDISSSVVQNNSEFIQNRIETDDLLIKGKSNEETFESSAEHNDSSISDAFLAKYLSAPTDLTANDSEKKTIETLNPDNVKNMDVPSTETGDNPIESNILDDKQIIEDCSVIDGTTHDPTENVDVKVITSTPTSEKSSIKTSAEPLKNGYRCPDDSWSEDDDSSSTSSDSSSDSDTFFEAMREGPGPRTTYPLMKTKGELELDDLPPIEELVISVEEKEMEKIGKVYAIVEKLVIVRALKDMRPLDLDSVLFLSHEKPLGRVFDVFGPVVEPFYSVRFNSADHINGKGVTVDADIFCAPAKHDITSFVFLDDLQNQKGSDASWRHNNEPPDEFLDFSDDEQERAARRKRNVKNRNQNFNTSSDVPAKRPSLAGDTPDKPIYIPPRPVVRRNYHDSTTSGYYRPNPFSTPRPVLSPAPALHRLVVSPAPSPYGIPQHHHNQLHLPFSIQSPPPPLPYQQPNMLQRHPQAPFMFAAHQQPVFGQVSMLSPALHTPPPFPHTIISNVPSLIPATHLSPVNPQNYFNQRFMRSPSPALQNGSPMSPDPWLPNRAPYSQSNLPPNAPLTVQIPPNIASQALPVHSFEQVNGSVQPFVNHQNVNFRPPFVNPQNMNFSNGNAHPRFY